MKHDHQHGLIGGRRVLADALALLAEGPHRWTSGAMARTSEGGDCRPTDPDAVSFSAIGAIARVAPDGDRTDPLHPANVAVARLDAAVGCEFSNMWNDGATYDEVILGFVSAIAVKPISISRHVALADAVRELVAALPKCACGKAATGYVALPHFRNVCDDHRGDLDAGEHPHAEACRRVYALLEAS